MPVPSLIPLGLGLSFLDLSDNIANCCFAVIIIELSERRRKHALVKAIDLPVFKQSASTEIISPIFAADK